MNCFNAQCPFLLLRREVLEQQGMVIFRKAFPSCPCIPLSGTEEEESNALVLSFSQGTKSHFP